MSKKILLGRFLKTHGVKGELKTIIHVEKDDDISFLTTSKLLLDDDQQLTVEYTKGMVQSPILKISGIDSIDAATKFTGLDFFVDRKDLPKIDTGYYLIDLVGLDVFLYDTNRTNNRGSLLGVVVGIPDYGNGELLEVQKTDTKSTELFVINDDTMPVVNVQEGYLLLRS